MAGQLSTCATPYYRRNCCQLVSSSSSATRKHVNFYKLSRLMPSFVPRELWPRSLISARCPRPTNMGIPLSAVAATSPSRGARVCCCCYCCCCWCWFFCFFFLLLLLFYAAVPAAANLDILGFLSSISRHVYE